MRLVVGAVPLVAIATARDGSCDSCCAVCLGGGAVGFLGAELYVSLARDCCCLDGCYPAREVFFVEFMYPFGFAHRAAVESAVQVQAHYRGEVFVGAHPVGDLQELLVAPGISCRREQDADGCCLAAGACCLLDARRWSSIASCCGLA